ncbi:MAG TPA: cupin domain-containing protein [Bryobacterales bacterium]|nr:cupin domain-containing protein [Bryobacterales bacterium]
MRTLLALLLTVLPLLAEKPLTERIVHTDPAKYRPIKSVHGGAGELHYVGLLDATALSTKFLFLHRGVLQPKGGIGNHFHHTIEEMYVIFDGEAEFTINGRTSTLKGPAAVPCKMGQAHAIYNAGDKPVEWMNIAVSSVKGKYDNFDTNDDRVGAPKDAKPIFVSTLLDRKLARPVEGYYGGKGTVHYRRAMPPEVFTTDWAYIDHLVIPAGASTGKRTHQEVEEVYYVMNGSGSVEVNKETAAIRKGDAIPMLLGDQQSFTNGGSADLELLIIGVARVKGALDPPGF